MYAGEESSVEGSDTYVTNRLSSASIYPGCSDSMRILRRIMSQIHTYYNSITHVRCVYGLPQKLNLPQLQSGAPRGEGKSSDIG